MSTPQDVRIVSADLPFSVMMGIAFKWVFAVAFALLPLGAIIGAIWLIWIGGH
jgi:hypothetical protein